MKKVDMRIILILCLINISSCKNRINKYNIVKNDSLVIPLLTSKGISEFALFDNENKIGFADDHLNNISIYEMSKNKTL